MAPGTNLGAATPVSIGAPEPVPAPPQKPDAGTKESKESKESKEQPAPGGDQAAEQTTMTKKQVHDAAAYIRSLAQMHGRNVAWAERAVREAVSLSAEEALHEKVIDVTARDVPDLLAKLNGRKVTTAAGERTLATADSALISIEPDWRTRFLGVVTDPSVALLLLMAGVYLLILSS
jgi:membrane-bound serine protease (ClpP class)